MEQWTGSKLGKEYVKAIYCHPAYLTYMRNTRLDEVQAGFRKGRGTRDQTANILWITEKAREFQKNIHFCFIDYTKAFECITTNCGKFLNSGNTRPPCPSPEKPLQVEKQQLEPDMEQLTGSKL